MPGIAFQQNSRCLISFKKLVKVSTQPFLIIPNAVLLVVHCNVLNHVWPLLPWPFTEPNQQAGYPHDPGVSKKPLRQRHWEHWCTVWMTQKQKRLSYFEAPKKTPQVHWARSASWLSTWSWSLLKTTETEALRALVYGLDDPETEEAVSNWSASSSARLVYFGMPFGSAGEKGDEEREQRWRGEFV